MENLFKQGSGIILLGFLCFALGSSAIEVVSAKEFNTTKDVRVRIWNYDIRIDYNGLIFIRVHTKNLRINCSIPNDSKKPINIGWKKGQIWLDGRSVRLLTSNNSRVLQLMVDHVTWGLNGSVYWCGSRDGHIFDTHVKGSQVTIITGDLPEPPRDIRHNVVGLRLYQLNIKWKPPTSVGRLPAHYNVTYIACINKTYCQGSPRYLFCTIPHLVGKVDYKCSKLREEMMSVDFTRDLYRVTIATVNPIGESKSQEFQINLDFGGVNEALYPTPSPPLAFNVSASDSSTITVQWTPRELWGIVNIRYTILYHKDKDHSNKTAVVQSGQTMLTLRKADGIEAYTTYYLYIVVEFIKNSSSQGSGVSEPLRRVIRTPEGEPDQGPDIFNTSSSRYPHNTTRRKVTFTWKDPLPSSWHGKPSHILIKCRNAETNVFKQYRISAIPIPPSQAVLPGLDSTVPYACSLTLCNSKECGPSGNEITIAPFEGPIKTDFTKTQTYWNEIVGICTFAFVILLFVFLWWFLCKRPSKTRGNQLSLKEAIGDLQSDYADLYQDVDQQSYSEEYDLPEFGSQ